MPKMKSQMVSTKVLQSGVTCDAQTISGVDILTSHMGIPVIQVYKGGLDVEVLERSLRQTLARYPLITGRMKKDAQGYSYLIGNDAGIPFSVHRCQGALPDYGPQHHMADHIGSFYTPIYPWNIHKDSTPLAHVNVYLFDDGGAILGISMVHSLIDGSSFWQFMVDWAEAAKGKDTPARPMDRSQLIKIGQDHLNDPIRVGYAYLATWKQWLGVAFKLGWRHLTDLDKGVYRIPAATVQAWKEQAQAEGNGAEAVMPSELVTAHCLKVLSPIWRADKLRYLGMVIDLRYKRSLRIPRYYFGNALAQRDVPYTAQELAQDSLARIGLKSRTSPEGLTTEDLHAYLGLMERARQSKLAWRVMIRSLSEGIDGGFMLNNCSHFPIYDIDFGTGRPTWHDPIRVTYRMVMVIDTPTSDGGFDIHVTGSKAELAAFKKLYG
jgi:shikimate O-hydroxycinnamoyltransferase